MTRIDEIMDCDREELGEVDLEQKEDYKVIFPIY
jgi:hypothetical protein